MAEQQKLSLCPRLVDYLAIVGARTTPAVHKGLPGNKTPPVQVSKQCPTIPTQFQQNQTERKPNNSQYLITFSNWKKKTKRSIQAVRWEELCGDLHGFGHIEMRRKFLSIHVRETR